MRKILIVGGTFDNEEGRRSGLVGKFIQILTNMAVPQIVTFRNGGMYEELEELLESAKDYDIVFWWPNVPNDLPKIRDVKEVAPHVMLVSSKRNDDDKYDFQELVSHALALKANLTFEFSAVTIDDSPRFRMRVFDPLGSLWYEGDDVHGAIKAALDRLEFLRSITRNSTVKSETSKELVMAWYFDGFKEDMYQSDARVEIPDEDRFISIVKDCAEVFQNIMKPAKGTTRFLGNCSMRPPVPAAPQVGRCGKGMPSFRKDGYIFVSQRNVDKQFLSLENFVPTYLEDGKVYYCGDKKPSVDTPIQLRLYEALPNINYMIHSHCYRKNAPFTTKCIPCGAVEEVDEVLATLKRVYGSLEAKRYIINLIGHGSIVMGNSVDDFDHAHEYFYGRQMPEPMYTYIPASEIFEMK